MPITHSSIVSAPIEEVFAWHTRTGAFSRLSPPWQPVRVLRESGSLKDGRAILRLPGGLTWVSRHDPEGYRPPHRFVDEIAADGLASLPVRALLPWRHAHEFTRVSESSTRVTDRVETPLGSHLLRPMFVYRHRQLADDLAAHQWAARTGTGPLTIAVTGASGLVGSALCAFLTTGGHRVVRLVRGTVRSPNERHWDPMHPDRAVLDGVDALIHLAGATIAGRFTAAHKSAVRDSRITPTRLLSELAANTDAGPKTLVVASAIGYYGADRGDEALTEDSAQGEGFLASVVADWEAATLPATDAGLRVANIRTGIVQSARGGTLQLFRPLFTLGLGGRVGSGRQWLSWVDLDDLIDVYYRALIDPDLSGPINAVAPSPVRNSEYARTLGLVLRRPAIVPAPSLGPRLLLGTEGSRELAEASQNVIPAKLRAVGHRFRQPDLEGSLRHQLGRLDR
ncbi:MAG: TIGR01777 family oxidoreductase [Microbacteriaceae bacterium]